MFLAELNEGVAVAAQVLEDGLKAEWLLRGGFSEHHTASVEIPISLAAVVCVENRCRILTDLVGKPGSEDDMQIGLLLRGHCEKSNSRSWRVYALLEA
jgi:hypothetical protein